LPWYAREIRGSENDQYYDKTRVKLFPNFTRHHWITHSNLVERLHKTISETIVNANGICSSPLKNEMFQLVRSSKETEQKQNKKRLLIVRFNLIKGIAL